MGGWVASIAGSVGWWVGGGEAEWGGWRGWVVVGRVCCGRAGRVLWPCPLRCCVLFVFGCSVSCVVFVCDDRAAVAC